MMSVDLRMAHIENGYEQLFIRAADIGDDIIIITPVPEPKIWPLLMLGLLSLGWKHLIRKKRS